MGHPLDADGSTSLQQNQTCRHLVILKEPFSGSTWFTEELNGIAGVRLKPQLFTAREVSALTAAKALDTMSNLMFSQCHTHTVVTGFTQNPELVALKNLQGFNLTSLRAPGPRAPGPTTVHYASWTRSNFVRRAFSIIGYRKTCQLHNVRTVAEQERCSLPYHVDEHYLLNELKLAACNNSQVRSLAEALAHPRSALHMTYEDFKKDNNAVLRGLLDFLQLPSLAASVSSRRRSSLMQRSPDNTSSVLRNAGDVKQWLRKWSHSAGGTYVPLEDMLQTDALDFNNSSHAQCKHMSRINGE